MNVAELLLKRGIVPAASGTRNAGNRTVDLKCDYKVSAGWNVRAEAKQFLVMVMAGRLAIEQAKDAILMTDRQLEWLIANDIAEPGMLRRIQWKRQVTWLTLKMMHRQATGKPIAA